MFKKAPQPKAAANIKSSERRRLVADVCDRFGVPRAALGKDAELALVPHVVKQAAFKSVQNISGTIYYDENETPVWFKTRDSGLFPSVFTAWRNPYLLPVVVTHEHVISILTGGADLMLPGTVPPFDPRIGVDTVVGIVSSQTPTVVKAVGVARLGLKGITKVVGTTGVAVEVLHTVGDELYKLNRYVDIEVPTELSLECAWDSTAAQGLQKGLEEPEQTPEKPEETVSEEPADTSEAMDELAQQVVELTLDEIDNFYVRSLLQSIKLDTIQLPINSSNFMANHVYKNLPDIDSKYKNIKKTSWKKTGKFLKQMAKQNYLAVKGKDDDLTITSLLPKTDKRIEEFITHKTAPTQKSKSTADSTSNDLEPIQMYQPTNKYRMFFTKLDYNYAAAYTLSEIKFLVNAYIKKYDLVVPSNPKLIKVDDVLGQIINGSPIARSDVIDAFLKHMKPRYVVLKPGQTISAAKIEDGPLPRISIVTETKIGRKTVTKVKNFEKFYIKPHTLSEDLRVLCSGSSTLEEDKGSTEVIVQGPHHKIIVDYLRSKGVPGNRIDFEDKSKKKKKRS